MRFVWILLALRGACAAEKKSLMRRQAQIEPDAAAPVEAAPEEPGQQPTLDEGHKTVSIDAQARAQVVHEEGASGAAPGASAGGSPGFHQYTPGNATGTAQDTPGNATDAAVTGTADGVSDAEFEAAAKFLDSDCGPLVITYANALIDLAGYWANTIEHASGNDTTEEDKRPTRERLQEIVSDWRTALGNHSRVGTCSEGLFAMDECMALTECIIQSSDCEATVPRGVLVTVVELEDEIKHSVWPAFELHFSPGVEEVVMGHSCHKPTTEELEAPAGPQFPMVDQVRGAAKLMAQVLAPAANSSLLALLKAEDLRDIWRDVCAGLGCDPASWLDIMDSLHGHTAELVSSQAPIRLIGGHIRTMRSSHRAFKHASGHFIEVLSDFLGQVTEREEEKQRSNTKRYDAAVRGGARVLNAAAQLWGGGWWKKAVKIIKSAPKYVCVGITIGCSAGWVTKINFVPSGDYGMVFGFGIKHKIYGADSWEKFEYTLDKLLSWDWDHVCMLHTTLYVSLLVGYVPGPPFVLGFRAGLFAAMGFHMNFCKTEGIWPAEIKLAFTVGVSGGWVTKFGFKEKAPLDIGIFQGVTGCGVGATLLCCSVTFKPEFHNGCKKW